MNSKSKPFFSIGVTTYNRREMLKECLDSMLRHTFLDFEVIVGNDYTQEILSADILKIYDSRIRFVNYSQNLGELDNMNALLAMSYGRYFTWLADDDMHAPALLQVVYTTLAKFDFPACLFTSFIQGDAFPERIERFEGKAQLFDGRQFLGQYLSRKLKAVGFYGFFDTRYLRQIGGAEQLGYGFSPYRDNLLVIKTGLLEKVIYIDAPLIFFRTHKQSMSLVCADVDLYSSAQKDLLSKSINIFKNERLSKNFYSNLFLLIKWCVADYCIVMHRSGLLQLKKLIMYILCIIKYIKMLRWKDKYKIMGILLCRINKLVITLTRSQFKRKFLQLFRNF